MDGRTPGRGWTSPRLVTALVLLALAAAPGCRSGRGGASDDVRDARARVGDTAEAAGDAPGPTDARPGPEALAPDAAETRPEPAEVVAPAPTPAQIAAGVERARYVEDLGFVAKPRVGGSSQWQAVQDRCAQVFADAGFVVERQAFDQGVNVVGVKAGAARPAEQVLISAHYDHVPGCDGADDNASGVAGVLEAARALGAGTYARTLVVACWDREETGLLGSSAYATRARQRGDDLKVAFVYEMIGYRDPAPGSQALPPGLEQLFPAAAEQIADNGMRGDFLAVIVDERARDAAEALEAHATELGLPSVHVELRTAYTTNPLFGTLQRSDHAAFWQVGYPAMMLTDTAEYRNAAYHCAQGPDSVERLDPDFAVAIVRATTCAAAATLEPLAP